MPMNDDQTVTNNPEREDGDAKQNAAITTMDPKQLSISKVDTAGVLGSLQTLFKTVMSGDDYNKEQVKSATNVSNAMVKVLRFEFDVYKYFNNRTSG
jgi:hypothetical protein